MICILGVPSGGTTVMAQILESWGYDGGFYGDGKQHECFHARDIIKSYWNWMDRRPHGSQIVAAGRFNQYLDSRNMEDKPFFKCPYASLLLAYINCERLQFVHVVRQQDACIRSAIRRWDKTHGPADWQHLYERLGIENRRVLSYQDPIATVDYEWLVREPQDALSQLAEALDVDDSRVLASCGLVQRR